MKNLLITIIALVLLGGAMYFYMTRDTGNEDLLLVGVPSGDANLAVVDNDLLTTLRQLRGITLNDEIFKLDAWKTFVDFGKILTPEPIGRPNPFAPLGTQSESVGTTTGR